MISTDTPYAANFNYPGLTAPYVKLEFSILEGHVNFETTGNSELEFIFIGSCFVFSLCVLRQFRKNKRL
jgi:hypothetical protein